MDLKVPDFIRIHNCGKVTWRCQTTGNYQKNLSAQSAAIFIVLGQIHPQSGTPGLAHSPAWLIARGEEQSFVFSGVSYARSSKHVVSLFPSLCRKWQDSETQNKWVWIQEVASSEATPKITVLWEAVNNQDSIYCLQQTTFQRHSVPFLPRPYVQWKHCGGKKRKGGREGRTSALRGSSPFLWGIQTLFKLPCKTQSTARKLLGFFFILLRFANIIPDEPVFVEELWHPLCSSVEACPFILG